MPGKTALCLVLGILLLAGSVAAEPIYSIVVKENGQSVVLIELEKGGTYTFTVPNDAEIEAKGALFVKNQSQVTAYTGNIKDGLIAYTTDSYTVKIKDVWRFDVGFDEAIGEVVVMVPENVYIRSFFPDPVIHNNKLIFNNTDEISIDYVFSSAPDSREKPGLLLYAVLSAIALAILIVMIRYMRKPKEISAQQNIIKTLPHNERTIIRILVEEDGGEIKRNILERKSKISKSSLANSLNNLEKKNIVEIDKTFVVHKVRLSKWFDSI